MNSKLKENNNKSYPKFLDYNIPYLQNNFVAFKQALAFKESQGKYTVVIYIPNLMKITKGKNTNKYTYFE